VDNLTEIISTLNEEQQKDFVAFIQRNKYRKDRKDLKLFELLKTENLLTATTIAKKLACPNVNAYHTVRKRLFKHLSDFIVAQTSTSDASASSHISTLLSVVRYLFEKGLLKYAWKYLEIAEHTAQKNDHFDYLHSIYLIQLEKAHLRPDLNFDEIIDKFNENKINLERAEKVHVAVASLQNKLLNQDLDLTVIDFSTLLSETLDQLSINQAILNRPRIALTFVKTFRKIALRTKSFLPLQLLLEQTLDLLKSKNSQINEEVSAELYYYLAHTQFRNRQFEPSKHTLTLANEEFKKTSNAFQKPYAVKRKQLSAALLLFTNELPLAIEALKSIIDQKGNSSNEVLNSSFNLAIYQLIGKAPKEALQQLQTLDRTDNWYEKTMGIEWVMKKQLTEIMLFIELGFIDLYESRIKAFKRKYKMFESHPIYYRVTGFLKAIELILNSPNQRSHQETIDRQLVFLDKEEEDLQAMIFYAWLKAKANKKEFYLTLLELAR
jgi:hypothetical protein